MWLGQGTRRPVQKPSSAVQKGVTSSLWHIEPLSAARTPRADFLNSLLAGPDER